MQTSYKSHALLALITAAALAPFVNKAFYVDDPLFIWMAQQIVRHPLDPYGFHLNWSSFIQPMSAVMQNPPLCSYYTAAIGSIFGWSEISLHAAFLFWATMSILGTFALAQRFCGLEGRAPSRPGLTKPPVGFYFCSSLNQLLVALTKPSGASPLSTRRKFSA